MQYALLVKQHCSHTLIYVCKIYKHDYIAKYLTKKQFALSPLNAIGRYKIGSWLETAEADTKNFSNLSLWYFDSTSRIFNWLNLSVLCTCFHVYILISCDCIWVPYCTQIQTLQKHTKTKIHSNGSYQIGSWPDTADTKTKRKRKMCLCANKLVQRHLTVYQSPIWWQPANLQILELYVLFPIPYVKLSLN